MRKNNSHNVQLNQSGSASNLPEIDKIIEVNNARLARVYEYISQVKTWVESKEEGSFSQFCKVVYLIELAYNNLLHLSKEFTSSELPLLKELVGRFFTEQGSWNRNDRVTAAHILNLQEAYKLYSQQFKDAIKKDFFTPTSHMVKEEICFDNSESTTFELLRTYIEAIGGNTALKLAKGKVKEELLLVADSSGLGDSFPPAFFVEQDARKYNKPLKTLRAEILETNKFISNLSTIQEDIFLSLEVQSNLSLAIQVMGNNFKLLLERVDKDKQDSIAKIIGDLPVWRDELAHSEKPINIAKQEIQALLVAMPQIESIFTNMALSEVVESGRNKGHNTMFDGLSVVSGITGSTQVPGAKSAQRKKGKATKKDNDWESILKEAQEDNIKASGLTKKQYEVAEEIVKMTLMGDGAASSADDNLKKFISEPNLVKTPLKIEVLGDDKVAISLQLEKAGSIAIRLLALLFAYGNSELAHEILVKYGLEGIKGNEGQVLRAAISTRNLEKVEMILSLYQDKPGSLKKILNNPCKSFAELCKQVEKLSKGVLPLVENLRYFSEEIALAILKAGASIDAGLPGEVTDLQVGIVSKGEYSVLDGALLTKSVRLLEYLIIDRNMPVEGIYSNDSRAFQVKFYKLIDQNDGGFLISLIRILDKVGKLNLAVNISPGHPATILYACIAKEQWGVVNELVKTNAAARYNLSQDIQPIADMIFAVGYPPREREVKHLELIDILANRKVNYLVDVLNLAMKRSHLSPGAWFGTKKFLLDNIEKFPYACALCILVCHVMENKFRLHDKDVTKANVIQALGVIPSYDLIGVIVKQISLYWQSSRNSEDQSLNTEVLKKLIIEKGHIPEIFNLAFVGLKAIKNLKLEDLSFISEIPDETVRQVLEDFVKDKFSTQDAGHVMNEAGNISCMGEGSSLGDEDFS